VRPLLALFAAAIAAVAALGSPAAAMAPMDGGAGPAVSIGFDAYLPAQSEAVVGDAVTWTNASVRNHTVTDIGGAWSSQRLFNGDTFTHAFGATGAFQYYCQVHPFMRGEVDVYRALLDAPAAPAAPNRPFPLTGRAEASATSVSIEADTGSGFQQVVTATPGSDGRFAAGVVPATTTTYRAVVDGEASPPITLLVLDRTLTVRLTRARGGRYVVSAHVAPAAPGATVVLQLRLRDRFGWWPLLQTRLDRSSSARFALRWRQRVPARVLLTLPDGATALATSRTVHLGGR
jgi:plastocyanin